MALIRFSLHATLLATALCGPAWGEDPPPPDEGQPFDIRTLTVNGMEKRVHDFRDPNAGLSWLNAQLRERHHPGSLRACSFLAGVYLTAYEEAFGGICLLDEGGRWSEVKVCADTGVGNFNLAPLGSEAKSADTAAEFVAGNCAGG